MATSVVNLIIISEIVDLEASSKYKNVEYTVPSTRVFTKFVQQIHSLVAMATSLENLGNEFKIINQENTTMAAKNESVVHMIGVMENYVLF